MLQLDPPFVSNFEGDQQVRFRQVTAQIMTHDPKTFVRSAEGRRSRIIRNHLLLLFSNQKATDLATNEGKEYRLACRGARGGTQGHEENDGKPEKVDAVLFTTFVMQ